MFITREKTFIRRCDVNKGRAEIAIYPYKVIRLSNYLKSKNNTAVLSGRLPMLVISVE